MKYYPHHIRDFNNATRHLTRVERSIYRDMIELYYEAEEQLPLDFDLLCRKVMARSDEERTAVQQALNEFFTKTPTGYFHEVCDEVIQEYHSSQSQKSAAGKASAAKRAARKHQAINGNSTSVATNVSTTVESPLNGTPTNQELITNNQEPEDQKIIAADDKSPPGAKHSRAIFDYSTGQFQNLSGEMIAAWRDAYPAIDVRTEIAKAKAWLLANPKNRKSNIEKFLTNWLSRSQDNAPRVPHENSQSAFGKPDNSAAGRVRANIARELAAAGSSHAPMANHEFDVRPQVGEQLRSGSGPGQGLGVVLEGSFARAD